MNSMEILKVHYQQHEISIISIMSFWNGEHNAFADTRFMYIKENELYSFLGSLTSGVHEVLDEYSGWPDESVKRNIKYSTNMKKNEDKFFSLVIDPLDKKFGEEYVGLYLYEDGKEIGNTWVSKKYYNFFLDGTKKIKYIEMGRCPVDYIGNWTYLKGICYAIRIYNKALRDGEVQANYDKTTDFHKYIIDSKKQKNL